MWIFLKNAFLSIVQYEGHPDVLLVRSRIVGDIERVLPEAEVTHTPESDYAYRALVRRHEVAQRLARAAEEIDYANFKNSVAELDRHAAYLKIWTVMREFQKRKRRTR
jgi:hypothetical protein